MYKILLIEDDETIVKELSEVLRRQGYACCVWNLMEDMQLLLAFCHGNLRRGMTDVMPAASVGHQKAWRTPMVARQSSSTSAPDVRSRSAQT